MTEIPESEKVYPGDKCSRCGAEIEVFEVDGSDVYLSCSDSRGYDHDGYRYTMKQLLSWGWKFDDEEIIESVVDKNITLQYILAEFGETLGVYPNGSVGIGQSVGDEIEKYGRPIAMVSCPGFHNIDQNEFTDGLTTYNEEKDCYDDGLGTEYTIEDCVQKCIDNNNFYVDRLINALLDDI